jgi:2-polyprenyl-6-hydroxyphenyl methylase / 3-demethylubiquinone-9 3-methyltransferase
MSSTVDEGQVALFDAAADDWWNPHGKSAWLHRYNAVRVPYIRAIACRHFGRNPGPNCLERLRIIDVGCGAGVLCEPLARLGASVLGADPGQRMISHAEIHARASGVDVDYCCATAEGVAATGRRFDVVLAMEVIEHVTDPMAFLETCGELVAPGGLLIVSTLNRTFKSLLYAIVIAEYVLHLLPRGTHLWGRFTRPEEIAARMCAGFVVTDLSGVTLNLRSRALQLSPDPAVNYILTLRRLNPGPKHPD